jgi:hypothetical protein
MFFAEEWRPKSDHVSFGHDSSLVTRHSSLLLSGPASLPLDPKAPAWGTREGNG